MTASALKFTLSALVVAVALVICPAVGQSADTPAAPGAATAAAPAASVTAAPATTPPAATVAAPATSATSAAKVPEAQSTPRPLSDANCFPIGVWAQDPKNAAAYKAMGVNLFLSLAGGPTEDQLAKLKAAGLYTICTQNEVGLKHKDDPTIIGWMHGDEPDNFRKDEAGKYTVKTPTAKIFADYEELKKKDPTRPVLLNLGQGVANDEWKGGWAKAKDYEEFVKACDIVSYDIYPVVGERETVTGKLELITKGVERLRQWSGDKKIVWFITEASHIKNKERMASPAEMRSEVWMALIAGARGIVYFCHQWEPTRDFAFPIHDETTRTALTAINKQVQELAVVLNSPTVADGATVKSSDAAVPITLLVKKQGGAVYVFAAAQRKASAKGSFTVPGLAAKAKAEVLGEGRTVAVEAGQFADDFGPYGVHLYKITAAE